MPVTATVVVLLSWMCDHSNCTPHHSCIETILGNPDLWPFALFVCITIHDCLL